MGIPVSFGARTAIERRVGLKISQRFTLLIYRYKSALRPIHGLIIVLALVVGRSAWLYLSAGYPFLPLSYDDLAKTLFSYTDVLQPGIWLPGPLVLNSLLMDVFPNAWLRVPAAVNWTSYMLMLAMLYGLGRDLFRSPNVGLMTVLIGASLRWPMWLGLSGSVESLQSMLIVGSAWGLVRWCQTDSMRSLVWAALAAGAATTIHYHAWMMALAFLGVVGFRAATQHRLTPRVIAASLVPFIFPIYWLIVQWVVFGDPLNFYHFHQQISQAKIVQSDLGLALAYFPELMIQVAPAIVVLGLLGTLWAIRAGYGRSLTPLGTMWLAGFVALINLALSGSRPSSLPHRWVVLSVELMLPLAGFLLVALAGRGRGNHIITLGLVVAVTLLQAPGTGEFPHVDLRGVRAGQQLSSLWEKGFLASDHNVLLEQRLWDYLAIQVLSSRPNQVRLDRQNSLPSEAITGLDDVRNPSILTMSESALAAYLNEYHVAMVLAYSEKTRSQLSRRLVRVDTWYDYDVYVSPSHAAAYSVIRP